MAQSSSVSTLPATRNITPQATGFSQVSARGGGEGGGQAMSVLLSWHEKVCDIQSNLNQPRFHGLSSLTDERRPFSACRNRGSRKYT